MNTYDKNKITKYLVFTFVSAYIIQFGVALLYWNGMAVIGQLILAAMMFIPMLGVFFAKGDIRTMGFKPQIRKNIIYILIAWFLPLILTAAGALLYFLVFPRHFDLNGTQYPDVIAQLESQGISFAQYILISVISSITYAPPINAVAALGEEIGWRGFLYPQLEKNFGLKKAQIFGGIIWGMWHWPLIALIGYEYGFGYFGFPITGMLLFCFYTVAIGIICYWLYERSRSIWLPSIFHGAINAAAGIPLLTCVPLSGSYRLLGPVPIGIIAGLPVLLLALFLCKKQQDQKD